MQKQKLDPAWVSGLPGSPGNVLPVAEIYKGLSCSKAAYARSCCFSATGSYVLSHFPLDNPSLHKTCNQLSGYSEGTQRLGSIAVTSAHWGRALERGTVWKRKTLPYFSVPDRHEVSVWREREREEGGSRSRRGGGFVGVLQAEVITSAHSGVVWKACYTRLLPG